MTMSRTDSIAMRQQPPVDLEDAELQTTLSHRETSPEPEQGQHDRQNGSKTKRIGVLVGNGILQLPIWGMQTCDNRQTSCICIDDVD